MKLHEALERLYAYKVEKRASVATLEILDQKAGHLLGFFGEDQDVSRLALDDVLEYMRFRRDKGVSDSTIKKELRELTGALRWLKRNGLYHADPSDLWPSGLLSSGTPRTRWLTVREFRALSLAMGPTIGYERQGERVTHAEPMGADWRDHLAVYVYTGVRYSELYRIRAVDVEGSRLLVRGTKTERAVRVVDVAEPGLDVLRRRAATFPTGPLFPFTSRDRAGKPSAKNQLRAWLKALDRGSRKARVLTLSTNDLRRTFASWAFQSGVPELVVVRWMGHGSNKMVREVYTQMSVEQGRREAAKMPGDSPVFPHHEGGDLQPSATQRNGNSE